MRTGELSEDRSEAKGLQLCSGFLLVPQPWVIRPAGHVEQLELTTHSGDIRLQVGHQRFEWDRLRADAVELPKRPAENSPMYANLSVFAIPTTNAVPPPPERPARARFSGRASARYCRSTAGTMSVSNSRAMTSRTTAHGLSSCPLGDTTIIGSARFWAIRLSRITAAFP